MHPLDDLRARLLSAAIEANLGRAPVALQDRLTDALAQLVRTRREPDVDAEVVIARAREALRAWEERGEGLPVP